MKPAYKISLIPILLTVVAGAGAYWYVFLKPHQNMENTKPEFKLSSTQLFNDFTEDETAANAKYSGKVVEVNGEVVTVQTGEQGTAIILEDELFGVSVYLDSSFVAANQQLTNQTAAGETITIRGKCDGMLNDVVISRAVIIQQIDQELLSGLIFPDDFKTQIGTNSECQILKIQNYENSKINFRKFNSYLTDQRFGFCRNRVKSYRCGQQSRMVPDLSEKWDARHGNL